MPSSALAAGRVTRSLMPPGGNALMMVIGRDGKASCATALRAMMAAAEAVLPMTNWRRSISTLHFADRMHRSLDALCVRIPERLELRLVHVGDDIADVCDRGLELIGFDDFLGFRAQPRDHRIRCTLRREQADPDREFDLVAEFL